MSREIAAPEVVSDRALRWIVGVCVASILLGAVLGALGGDIGAQESHGSNGYSTSALGLEAFREVLRRLDIPAISSRDASGRKTSAGGLLVIAAPEVNHLSGMKSMIADSRSALLVLPKWRGRPFPTEPRWVEEISPVSPFEVESVLREAGVDAALQRIDGAGTEWRGEPGPAPTLRFAQLLDGKGLTPLVRCREGVLLAEVAHPGGSDRKFRVLSDPDLIANMGLGLGGNAELAVAVVQGLRGVGDGGGMVVMDETIHGFTRGTGIWREMLSFPLALVAVHALLAAAVAVLAGGVRFGAPSPDAAAIEPGKRVLVDNTARLLQQGGHSREILVRYWRTSFRDAAESLHAPGTPGSSECVSFLDRVAETRGARHRASELGRRVRGVVEGAGPPARTLVAIAADIHAWREEMTRGH